MTDAAPPFTFVDDPASYRPDGTRVILVPAKAKGKEKLLGTLAQKLQFPRYFGHNWDALDECLGDLSWLKGIERIAIVHEGLPFAADGEHLPTYLSILADAVTRHRQPEVPPLLEVVFATRQQTAVLL